MYTDRNTRSRVPGHAWGRRMSRGSTRGRFVPNFEETLPSPELSQKMLNRFSEQELNASFGMDEKTKITEVQYVSSYNWLDRDQPTILVPGIPPKWLPPGREMRVRQDTDDYYRDPNAARYPTYPIEPAVSSIFNVKPDFDSQGIDVFGCGSTIGSLLCFVRGESCVFRIGIELIGNSLFLVRRTNTPKQLIDGVSGYGHNFADAYTAWRSEAGGSASHQRIISYNFGGLKCLVRSECEGYLPDLLNTETSESKDIAGSQDNVQIPKQLDSNLESLRMNLLEAGTETDLIVQSMAASVSVIPQDALFSLKTRSLARLNEVRVDEFLRRLWINQTPNLVLAFHQHGFFQTDDIQIHDTRLEIKQWEETHEEDLKKLKILLHLLRARAGIDGCSRLEVRRAGTQPLEIWTCPDGWEALPEEWRKRWTEGKQTDTVDE